MTRPYAGSGVGKSLLTHAHSTLAARGVTRVRATVDADNEDGRAFFESRGYRMDAVTLERAL